MANGEGGGCDDRLEQAPLGATPPSHSCTARTCGTTAETLSAVPPLHPLHPLHSLTTLITPLSTCMPSPAPAASCAPACVTAPSAV